MKSLLKWKKTIFVTVSALFLTGCEGTTTSVSVGYGIYGGYGYGYCYGYYPPYYRPPHRPDRPDKPRPEHPIGKPDRPTTLPSRPSTRPSRPSMGRPTMRPMSRPSGGMRMGRR